MLERRELRQHQLSGAIVGVILGVMTANFWPDVREAIGGWLPAILWGGVLGALLSSLTPLGRIAQRFTGRDNPLLNQAVGLLIPFLLAALCAGLWRLMSVLVIGAG